MKLFMRYALLLCAISSNYSHAFWEDSEARSAIKKLQTELNEIKTREEKTTLDITQQINETREYQHLQLGSTLQNIVGEQRKMQGQIEVIQSLLSKAKTAEAGNYSKLRAEMLSIIEKNKEELFEVEGRKIKASSAEIDLYRLGLRQFDSGDFILSAATFRSFSIIYANSKLLVHSYYWLGNSFFALGDCQNNISVQSIAYQLEPNSLRAADILISRATCHKELGQIDEAKKLLSLVIEKFPNTNAAELAKNRLISN